MRLHSLMLLIIKMHKAAHGAKQAPRNRKAKAKAPGQSAAAGMSLVKVIAHLRELGVCHANPSIKKVND